MSNLLPLNNQLHNYLLSHSLREPDALNALREETLKLPDAGMMTLPDQAQFIQCLLMLMRAKRVIEVGSFTGYATGWMALALPKEGQLIACDVNQSHVAMGQPYWEQLGISEQIDVRIADAAKTLNDLVAHQAGAFDAIFIDADKLNYDTYYELSLQLVRTGGLIIFDNLLWSGKVADLEQQDKTTQHLRYLTDKLHNDKRVSFSLVTVADGMGLVIKQKNNKL